MLDALYISAIGLEAQKQQLDTLANNFANLGTAAFKRQSVDFAAVLDRAPQRSAADAVSEHDAQPRRLLRVDLAPGELHATGRPLDVAIAGAGFLEVELSGGRTGYARAGSLEIDVNGALTLRSGQVLKADVRIPNDASSVLIGSDGIVSARLSGDEARTELGHIELAIFTNPECLQYRGEGIFILPEEGAEPLLVRPGENGTEPLSTGSLESSNVDMTDEMVALMLVQRVYELNSRVVQIADELMGMTNNLRRG